MAHQINLRNPFREERELEAEHEIGHAVAAGNRMHWRKFLTTKKRKLVFLVALILLVWAGSCYISSRTTWRAVFLENNQVYFGKLSYIPFWPTARLTDVYYLQVNQLQPEQPNSNISLIKLGNEIHGPKDAMTIPVFKILFWEDLRSDSQVVKLITESK